MHLRMAALALGCLTGASLCQTADVVPQQRRLRADLDFLTSGVLAGRLSLSPEAEIAARYIASDFERSGLQPASGSSYLQEFPLIAYRSDPQERSLTLTRGGVARPFPTSEIGGGFKNEVRVTAPVMFAVYGISAPEYGYDDYARIDATGKSVLMFDH